MTISTMFTAIQKITAAGLKRSRRMSNSSLHVGYFCFFSTLLEGLFCYINVYLNTGPLFENFSSSLFYGLVMFGTSVLAKCMVTSLCLSSSIPCVGFFMFLGSSRWRPLQGCPNLVNVSVNCLSQGTDRASASCTIFSY